MKLSEKIYTLRKDNHLSQEQFSELFNVSRHTVHRWETGETKPNIDQLRHISNHFGIPLDNLSDEELDVYNNNKASAKQFRMTFWLASAVILAGLVSSALGWEEPYPTESMILGIILMITGCVLFEITHPWGADNFHLQHKRFYALNIWMLLPTPTFLAHKLFIAKEQIQSYLSVLAAGAIYLLIALIFTLYMLRNDRK